MPNHQQLVNANKCEIIDKCIPSILSKNYSVAISASSTFILKCRKHSSEVKLLLKDLWKSRKPKLTTKLWSRGALKAQTKKKKVNWMHFISIHCFCQNCIEMHFCLSSTIFFFVSVPFWLSWSEDLSMLAFAFANCNHDLRE